MRFTNGSRNLQNDVRKSQLTPDRVRRWLRQQSKRLLTFGFRSTGKQPGQVYQCWLMRCQEMNVFVLGSNIAMSRVLYPFVTYLLPLPRNTQSKTFAIKEVVVWYFEHFRHEYFCDKVPVWTSKHSAHLSWNGLPVGSKQESLPTPRPPPSREWGYPDNLHNSRTFMRDTSMFKSLGDPYINLHV
jgi:hypothetical protein